jgi:hypothetical protein
MRNVSGVSRVGDNSIARGGAGPRGKEREYVHMGTPNHIIGAVKLGMQGLAGARETSAAGGIARSSRKDIMPIVEPTRANVLT